MPGLIKYTVEKSQVPVPQGNPAIGYRLKVTCTEFVGHGDTAIFCYKWISQEVAVFSHVASFADMEAYAAGTPAEPLAPFFRLPHVDLVFSIPEVREETLSLILADFVILTDGFDTTSVLSDIYSGAEPAALPLTEISGVITGDNTDTYAVAFPTTLAQVPKVFVAASATFGVTVTPLTTGFSLVTSRAITPTETVSWHLG